ncbi:MAG: universal stress protein [Polyangiaceae bacterium]|nr:universal stress protein [Polyangiaceae bacterium]
MTAGDPATEIVRFADAVLADLIVLGARDYRGWKRRVWGSIYRAVAARASVSVVVSRPGDYAHGTRVPVVAPPRVRASAPTWLHSSRLHERSACSEAPRRSGAVPSESGELPKATGTMR